MRAMEMVAEGFPSPILLRHEKIQSSLAIVKGLLQGIRNSFLVGGAVGEAVDVQDLDVLADTGFMDEEVELGAQGVG